MEIVTAAAIIAGSLQYCQEAVLAHAWTLEQTP